MYVVFEITKRGRVGCTSRGRRCAGLRKRSIPFSSSRGIKESKGTEEGSRRGQRARSGKSKTKDRGARRCISARSDTIYPCSPCCVYACAYAYVKQRDCWVGREVHLIYVRTYTCPVTQTSSSLILVEFYVAAARVPQRNARKALPQNRAPETLSPSSFLQKIPTLP